MAAKLKSLCAVALLAALLCSLPVSPLHAAGTATSRPDQIQVLADDDYFPILLEMIGAAESRVDLAMFIFKTSTNRKRPNRPDQIRDALINSAKRGVRVRVFLEESGYNEKINETNRRVANRLKQAGVEVIFDTLKKTTHNKMVVIDRRYSIVGSHNFTHAALKYNHELSLLIDDPILAATLVRYLETTIQPEQ